MTIVSASNFQIDWEYRKTVTMTSRSVGKTAQVCRPLGATSHRGYWTLKLSNSMTYWIFLPYINIEALLDLVTYWIL